MTEPRAVVDVVGTEPGADQLLKQIGFFVRALGRTEASERIGPVPIPNLGNFCRHQTQRLIPGCLAE